MRRFIRRRGRFNSRRTFRRTRYSRYGGSRSRRIVRRALRRRPLRPEIKYIDISANSTSFDGLTPLTFAVTPTLMDVGASNGQRIGQQVSFRKVNLRFFLYGAPAVTDSTQWVQQPEYYIRMVLWTPRVDYSKAASYMGTISTLTVLDIQTITVHRDNMVRISRQVAQEVTASGNLNLGQTGCTHVKFFNPVIMFPRNARFTPTSIPDYQQIDVDKDILYCTLYSNIPTTTGRSQYAWSSRLTYVDA